MDTNHQGPNIAGPYTIGHALQLHIFKLNFLNKKEIYLFCKSEANVTKT